MNKRDRVRLIEAHEGLPIGAEGRVTGYYRRVTGDDIAVTFDSGPSVPVPEGKLRVVSEAEQAQAEQDNPPPNQMSW